MSNLHLLSPSPSLPPARFASLPVQTRFCTVWCWSAGGHKAKLCHVCWLLSFRPRAWECWEDAWSFCLVHSSHPSWSCQDLSPLLLWPIAGPCQPQQTTGNKLSQTWSSRLGLRFPAMPVFRTFSIILSGIWQLDLSFFNCTTILNWQFERLAANCTS